MSKDKILVLFVVLFILWSMDILGLIMAISCSIPIGVLIYMTILSLVKIIIGLFFMFGIFKN